MIDATRALAREYRDRTGPGRRTADRHPCHLETFFEPIWGEFRPLQAHLRDISTHGLGLISGRHMEPGTKVVVLLPVQAPQVPPVVPARVTYATRREGGWLLGCAFVAELLDSQLDAVLHQAHPGPGGGETPPSGPSHQA
jgi:hypothetical protein